MIDLKAYSLHIQMLEVINMIIYFVIIISSSITGYILKKELIFALIGLLVGILLGYLIYSIIQLNADKHKLQIEIYKAIIEKKAE